MIRVAGRPKLAARQSRSDWRRRGLIRRPGAALRTFAAGKNDPLETFADRHTCCINQRLGAKHLIGRYADWIAEREAAIEGAFTDLETPEAFLRLERHASAVRLSEPSRRQIACGR